MSFISYAQNYEDVILWRALKHIENGFYIDVGANDPIIDSVTKSFYDAGWSGINIEPINQWFKKLNETRTRDINLKVAAGAKGGKRRIYELPDTGLSTMDKAVAERHEAEHGFKKIERRVPVKTLTEICLTYHVTPIHFLKIDVEGAEKIVLEGLDLKQIRPWIIVVESTLPSTENENHEIWEPIILGADYEYIYFDGLNRFYLSKEHAELKKSFKKPPNVFDSFISRQQFVSEQRAKTAEGQLKVIQEQLTELQNQTQSLQNEWDAAKAKVDELNKSSHHWRTVADQFNRELQSVYASKSRRITWPLRKLMQGFKWLFVLPIRITLWLVRLPKRSARWLLLKAMAYALKRPGLKVWAMARLRQYPNLEAKLRRLAQAAGLVAVTRDEASVPTADLSSLTPSARRIYIELKAAIEACQKENG